MHWRNSNFQITYFIAGACHTPDEAYRKLRLLQEERKLALEQTKGRPRGDSFAGEVEAACAAAAQSELDYIELLIQEILPQRKYKDLPDPLAFQMCQAEEWALELVFRAQNFLVSQGTIPADQLGIMRHHPAWESLIGPEIARMTHVIREKGALDFSDLKELSFSSTGERADAN